MVMANSSHDFGLRGFRSTERAGQLFKFKAPRGGNFGEQKRGPLIGTINTNGAVQATRTAHLRCVPMKHQQSLGGNKRCKLACE